MVLGFIFQGCHKKEEIAIESKLNAGKQGSSMESEKPVKSINSKIDQFLSSVDSNSLSFMSFSAKGVLNFNMNGNTKSADINIRIKKDEIIWFYINWTIIPVAQGMITPGDIKIKNLLTGEYTHKGFDYLNDLSGVPINFQDLQSILVGNKISSFIKDSSQLNTSNQGGYLLFGKLLNNGNIFQNHFYFSSHYRPVSMDIKDSVNNRNLNLKYSNFIEQSGSTFPQNIYILAKTNHNSIEIQMDYKRIQFNPSQDYPFTSPDETK